VTLMADQPPLVGARDEDVRFSCIRVLVVSENQLHGEGLALRLSVEPGIRAVGPHESIRRTLPLASSREVDVVLVDVVPTPDNQYELAAAVRSAPRVPFVTLAEADSETEILAWAEAGASAIVDRKGPPVELAAVLEAAMRGVALCSPRVAGALLRRVQTLARDRRPAEGTARLTQRERDVLILLGHGMSNKQIARHLGLQLPTVKNHVHNIFEKLEVTSRSMAVALATSLEQSDLESDEGG
jgi:two-component system, NarL family, nitrate/nitrite response regulator NarL